MLVYVSHIHTLRFFKKFKCTYIHIMYAYVYIHIYVHIQLYLSDVDFALYLLY